MRRKNQTKDSVKIVSYDPGRYTGPWEGSYPESYELAVYSDRTDLEIDPDDVWMDPAGDYISFEEALNDIKENAVEILPLNQDVTRISVRTVLRLWPVLKRTFMSLP